MAADQPECLLLTLGQGCRSEQKDRATRHRGLHGPEQAASIVQWVCEVPANGWPYVGWKKAGLLRERTFARCSLARPACV